MSESDTSQSDTSQSDISDIESISDVDLSNDFDEIVYQITSIQVSYESSIERLQWLQKHINQTIPLDDVLDDLHTKSLQEIEETGKSSFVVVSSF